MTYRLIAQNILTGEWLNWNVPLDDVNVTDNLSGPSEITGVFRPEQANLNLTTYDAWSTWLHLEEGGQIRGSAIIKPTSLDGPEVKISCIGHSGYPHGIPYMGDYSGRNLDPFAVVREIWRHVQSYPDGNLGVTVDDTTSTARIATTASEDPYRLAWWDAKDCGQEIDNLAREAPFDYVEVAEWNDNHTAVRHHIRLGHPRIGRRLTHLRFADGENILGAVPLAEAEDAYASAAMVLGAGEGRTRIRGTASERGNRLRRVAVITDKSVTKSDRARANAQDELRLRKARYAMEEITIDTRHPNARLGTFSVGDDIPVTGRFPWVGRVTIWHRITSITWSPGTSTAVLRLRASDTFQYGSQ